MSALGPNDVKTGLTLTVEERLTLENLMLKAKIAEAQLAAAQGNVQVFIATLSAQRGVDLNGWEVNLETGMCIKPGSLGSRTPRLEEVKANG